MKQFSTFVEVVKAQAEARGDRRAYTFLADGEEDAGHLTFAQVDQRARAIGAVLQAMQARGERVLLIYPPGLHYVTALYGCLYAGMIAVPAYPPRLNRNLGRLRAIIKDAQPIVAFTTSEILANIKQCIADMPDLNSVRWLTTDSLDVSLCDAWQKDKTDHQALALLQYSSGSTAEPKGVMVSHANLLYNQAMMREAFHHGDDTVMVSWLPLYHDMGLIGVILASMYNGVPCYFMAPTDFLKKPFRWLNAISRFKATFCGAPNFAYDLCVRRITPEQREMLDLSSWKLACNGSEPLRADTLGRFTEAFAVCGFRPEVLNPVYGLAEATLFVSGGAVSGRPLITTFDKAALGANRIVATDDLETGVALVSCGGPWLDERIIIADPTTKRRCNSSEVGEIWISGTTVANGYWNRPDATNETFRARPSDGSDSLFLRTGDLGVIHQGSLYVTGRMKDLIILRGQNHYPQDIEFTAESSHPALRPGSSAAFSIEFQGSERLVLVAEVERERRNNLDVTEVIGCIRRAIACAHELDIFSVMLILPGALLKTSSGKIQRNAMRIAFIEGSLEGLYLWRSPQAREIGEAASSLNATAKTRDSVEGWLALEVGAQLEKPFYQIEAHRPLSNYGLDSLAAVQLIARIEETFDIRLAVESLFKREPSIAQVAALICEEMDRQIAAAAAESSDEDLRFGIGNALTAPRIRVS